MKAAIMTLFLPRMEIDYIKEWLDYHILIGFDHFFLYDNGMWSTEKRKFIDSRENIVARKWGRKPEMDYKLDKTDKEIYRLLMDLLDPYIKKGFVTLIFWNYKYYDPENKDRKKRRAQVWAMNDCLSKRRRKKDYDWLAYIDVDEFIYAPKNKKIGDLLEAIDSRYAGIRMVGRVFDERYGDDGKKVNDYTLSIVDCESLLVPEIFRKSNYKCIIRPRHVKKMIVHDVSKKSFFKKVKIIDPYVLRYNHYKGFRRGFTNGMKVIDDKDFSMKKFVDILDNGFSKL